MSTRTKLVWVAILYFAEGFPFGLVVDFFPTYFRHGLGLSLTDIGLFTLASLPWTLKFLWAPLLDWVLSRRTWIVGCQITMGITLLGFLSMTEDPGIGIGLLLFSMAVFSATQDIAIDAYTIELLDPKEMGPANGLRVTTYRVALITAGGWFVAAADPAHALGWKPVIGLAAILLIGFSLISARIPPIPTHPHAKTPFEIVIRSLGRFFKRPGFLFIMLFILTFKLGDMAMGPMIRPFWVDRQFSPIQIGLVPGTVGVLSTIAGALAGGWLTGRVGIFHGLWILGLLQAVSNLVYALAAALPPSIPLMYTASITESFTGGLGTAPFLAFLMSICDKEHAATQYALLSALFGLTRSLSGAVSGVATEHLGYATYFTTTFFLAFPAFLLLPWVKEWTKSPS
jgi:PAT family beta-lactamase induction signal transducer AmpG